MRKGFTLVELLIVIAILGILSTLGVGNFQTSRIKARDISRKADLQAIAKSLEAYANDHRSYPISTNNKITCDVATICDWGTPFKDLKGTIYIAKLPDSTQNYIFESDGTEYTLYARLENPNDPSIDNSITKTCGTPRCNYKIMSSNQ